VPRPFQQQISDFNAAGKKKAINLPAKVGHNKDFLDGNGMGRGEEERSCIAAISPLKFPPFCYQLWNQGAFKIIREKSKSSWPMLDAWARAGGGGERQGIAGNEKRVKTMPGSSSSGGHRPAADWRSGQPERRRTANCLEH
jgi:hypothetical protein